MCCFNPHSSFRPSATPGKWCAAIWVRHCFNPHSSFRPSATHANDGGRYRKRRVSILTRAFARVQPPCIHCPAGQVVSILTRAFARVQPPRLARAPSRLSRVSILTRAFARVQRIPDAGNGLHKARVSILTRAFARVQPGLLQHDYLAGVVSILTRAFARVQQGLPSKLEALAQSFNPHSSFRPSATHPGHRHLGGEPGFNPHSSFRPSATAPILTNVAQFYVFQSSLELSPECNLDWEDEDGDRAVVSILTRAFARVQPSSLCAPAWAVDPRFNPHSSFRPSATMFSRWLSQRNICFNPHSSFRPSATYLGGDDTRSLRVSILTRAFARVQPGSPPP